MAVSSSSSASEASLSARIGVLVKNAAGDHGLPFLLLLLQPLLLLALGIVVAFVVLPWVLALATVLRDHCWRGGSIRPTSRRRHEPARSRREETGDPVSTTSMTLSDALSVLTLYKGRVWHTRFRPARHSFTYPVFLFEVDLTMLHRHMLQRQQQQQDDGCVLGYSQDDCDRALRNALRPLSMIIDFSSKDHLKNGEGLSVGSGRGPPSLPLLRRIQNLLRDEESRRRKEETQSPSTEGEDEDEDEDEVGNEDIWDLVGGADDDRSRYGGRRYRAVLVTNLSYYGYCFNPVSYYLVLDDRSQQQQKPQPLATTTIAAVVGEVSNTPWGEMHCYVLLPAEKEMEEGGAEAEVEGNAEADDDNDNDASGGGRRTRRFVFPKTFHVSPFMEMNYDYDWSFRYATSHEDGITTMDIHNSLLVVNKEAKSDAAPTRTKVPRQRQFHARLLVQSSSTTTTPTSIWSIAYQLSCYPMYGLIVQLWIHYQALWLFVVRRVPFQPHPNGSETAASRLIGALMTPLFAVQALCDEWVRTAPAKGDPIARGTSSPCDGAEKKEKKKRS